MNKLYLYTGVACLVALIATLETSDAFTTVSLCISTVLCIGAAFDNDRVDRRHIKNDTERAIDILVRIEKALKELKDRG